MKKRIILMTIFSMLFLSSCEGPQGPPGLDGQDGFLSEVFELRNINFGFNATDGYTIYRTLNPQIASSDVLLIYRLSGTINSSTPIWQQIPRTLFLPEGELDYDFDFSKQDFTIFAGGTYNLALTPSYINGQTFRIVIVPGILTNKSANKPDFSNYYAVIKAYNIDDSNVKVLN